MTMMIKPQSSDDSNEKVGSIPQWEKFPVECLPPVLRDYCLEVAKSTNTDPAYIATFALPVLSSTIGSHVVLEVKSGWTVPAILWTMVLANSGSGKSPTLNSAIHPLIKMQRQFDRESDEDNEKCCLISNITTAALIPILANNPYGVCAVHNEASTWLGSFNWKGTDEGVYNDIYDGGYVKYNRKTGKKRIVAPHTHTSISAAIQPNILKSILLRNPQFFYSGFMARFLMTMPPDSLRHYSDAFVSEPVVNAYRQVIGTLFDWRKTKKVTPDHPYCVKLSPEATELFALQHDILEDERVSLPADVMQSILPKIQGYTLRLALVLHITEFASHCSDGEFPDAIPNILEGTMDKAITLTEWYMKEAQRILQKIQPGITVEGDREVVSILKHIQGQGGQTTARKVAQNLSAFNGSGGSEKASEKLESMFRNGLLTVRIQKVSNGSITREYFLANADNNDSNHFVDKGLSDGVGVVGGVGADEIFDGESTPLEIVGNRGEVKQPGYQLLGSAT
jgi:hypothetical protein